MHYHRLFWFLFVAALSMAATVVWMNVTYDPRPPIERWIRIEALNSPVKAGETLQIRVHRIKVRSDCPVSTDRQLINVDGKPFDLLDAHWMGGSAEKNFVELGYDLPASLPPGVYVLRVFLTYTCPGFVWPTQQPDLLFTVAE